MTTKPLISIVIPFYNTKEIYISELLELLKSKNDNVECIFVNDGSEEKISALVKNYCSKNNFKYIEYFPNMGVSHARNVGIANANGKYLLFVDSDDLIDIDLLNKISLGEVEKDLYFFKDCLLLNKKPVLLKKELSPLNIDCDFSELFLLDNLKLSTRSACNKLLKREILVKNNLYFDEDLQFYEDSLFMSVFYQRCISFEAYDNILYIYRIYNDSSSRRYNKNYMALYERYFYKFKETNHNQNMLKGLYRDTIKNVFVDKTILYLKKIKFCLMFKVAKYNCIFDSSKHLLTDNNKFVRKLSVSLCKKHYFAATNRVVFHQVKLYSLFLLNKIFKKSKI